MGEEKVKTADQRRFVEVVIDQELAKSPLTRQGATFVRYGDEFGVDPLLAVAIAFHESRYCLAYADWHNREYHNCAGIMNGGQGNGLVAYPDWESFIKDYLKLLSRYIHQDGRDTIGEIGSKYAPVDSHYLNRSWNGGVTKKYRWLWGKVEKGEL